MQGTAPTQLTPPTTSAAVVEVDVAPISSACDLGMALHRQGQWDQAIAHYQQAIAASPQDAELHFRLGLALDQQGQLGDAVRAYERAIAFSAPNSPQGTVHLNALSNLGCVWLKQGEGAVAVMVLQRAIAQDDCQASLHNNLGRALLLQGDEDGAIAAFQRAIALQPELMQAHYNLGCVWQQRHQSERAIAAFQQVTELDPCHTEAFSRLGQLYLNRGRFAETMACWQRVLRLQPEFVDAFCRRVLANGQPEDELAKAQAHAAQFLVALWQNLPQPQLVSALARTYRSLGWLLLQEGGLEQADDLLRKAVHLQPRSLEGYLLLGDVLMQQGRLAASLAVLHSGRLQGSNPSPQDEARLLERLVDVLNQQRQIRTALPRPVVQSLTSRQARTRDWLRAVEPAGGDYIPLEVASGSRQPVRSGPPPQRNSLEDAGTPTPDTVCGGVTCGPCMARLRSQFQPVQVRDGLFHCAGQSPLAADLDAKPHEPFVVTLPEGRAWVAPQASRWQICNQVAVMTADGTLLADLSRVYPWHLPGCDRPTPDFSRLSPPESLPPVKHLRGRVALLSGLSAHVYYHWMVDVLPRWGLLQQAGFSADAFDYVVVNSRRQPFQKETLELLGVAPEQVIESDRHPHIQAEQLIVPSFAGPLDWVPLQTLEFLRRTVLDEAVGDSHLISASETEAETFPDCIYISRAHARYRQVINEDEVIAQVQPFGVVPVLLEQLSVQQQARLFAQAKVIIAPHGAGLTNLAFCQPGTQVLELTSPHYVRTDYWIFSQRLDLTHYFIQGEPFASAPLRQIMYQNPLTEDIRIPRSALTAALQQMGLSRR